MQMRSRMQYILDAQLPRHIKWKSSRVPAFAWKDCVLWAICNSESALVDILSLENICRPFIEIYSPIVSLIFCALPWNFTIRWRVARGKMFRKSGHSLYYCCIEFAYLLHNCFQHGKSHFPTWKRKFDFHSSTRAPQNTKRRMRRYSAGLSMSRLIDGGSGAKDVVVMHPSNCSDFTASAGEGEDEDEDDVGRARVRRDYSIYNRSVSQKPFGACCLFARSYLLTQIMRAQYINTINVSKLV
jgi:hypothetical protein